MKRVLFTVLCILSVASPCLATDWHVYANGSGDFPTIQAALDGSAPGDRILVGPGTYHEALTMRTLRELASEDGAAATIIDAQSTGSVIHVQGMASGTRIIGFTLQNGNASVGGGLYCSSSTMVFEENIVRQNRALSGAAYGGGIYATLCSSAMQIRNNLIYDNEAYIGGGICCNGTDHSTIEGNTIVYNTAIHAGGVISYNGSNIAIRLNIVAFNSAVYTGGIYVHSSSSATIACNDVYQNVGGNYQPSGYPTQWDISVDPLFCSPETREFHLTENSPCLPGHHPDGSSCGLMGALDATCPPPTLIESYSWGRIKAGYR